MPEFVADTHAIFWYLMGMSQLGPNALLAFQAGEQGQATIILPSIVLAELYYLNLKVGSPLDFSQEYQQLKAVGQFVMVDFQADDVLHFNQLSVIPEMHDRIIATVAFVRKYPCLTRDPAIIGSGVVQTIW